METGNTEPTSQTQAEELAVLAAHIKANEVEMLRLGRELDELHKRREFVATRLERGRLRSALGSYVKLVGDEYMEPKTVVKPKAGAIGRLISIGRTRAMVDFGEDLHTWYVPLTAVSPVTDPLTQGSVPERSPMLESLERALEEIHEDIMRDDELTDEERWEDNLSQP
jgi:hypothetical protein